METASNARLSFSVLVNAARETKLALRMSGPIAALDVLTGQRGDLQSDEEGPAFFLAIHTLGG